jgi:hypothetical protein
MSVSQPYSTKSRGDFPEFLHTDDFKTFRHLLYPGHHPIRRARELEPLAPDAAAILVKLRDQLPFRSPDITRLQAQVHFRLPWVFHD